MEDLERLKEIIDNLKHEKKIKNLSDLGRLIDYSPQTLTNILNGRKQISKGLIKALKDKFPFIDLNYVQTGEKSIQDIIGIPYLPRDEFGAFGMKYMDREYLQRLTIKGVPEITRPADMWMDIPVDHPDYVFLKDDLAYAIKVENAEIRSYYFIITKKKELLFGQCKSFEGEYFIASKNFHSETNIPLKDVLEFWKVSGIYFNRITPEDRYRNSITPKDLQLDNRELRKKNKQQDEKIKMLEAQLKKLQANTTNTSKK